MGFEILDQIRSAETQAEQMRQDALAQAREMIKATQEAIAAAERQALGDLRKQSAQALEEKRRQMEKTLAQSAQQTQATSLDALSQAQNNIPKAAALIVGKVLADGHR